MSDLSLSALEIRSSAAALRREPGFAVTVILALAIGIGTNTALYTVVNGLLFRPLPYRAPEQLVELQLTSRLGAAFPEAMRTRAATTLEPGTVAGFQAEGFQIQGTPGVSHSTRRYGFRVSPNFFAVLGVTPVQGRMFDERSGSEPAVMLAYDYWRKEWGGDPEVAGKAITIGAATLTIAGVLPAEFTMQVRDGNLFVASDPALFRDARWIARRKDGSSAEQVRSEVESLLRGAAAVSNSRPGTPAVAAVVPIEQAFRSGDAFGVVFLQGALGLVLLITCANVGNLMIARSLRRRREFAIRAALGASGGRIVRQLLTESALLAAAGTALGLLFTAWTHRILETLLPVNLQRALRGVDATALDFRVAAFAIALSAAAVLLCGLAPAFTVARLDVMAQLKATARNLTPGHQSVAHLLVGAEVALSVMLLVGAGLLLKSVVRIDGANLGFSPEGVVRAIIDLSPQRHPTPELRAAGFRRILSDLQSLPGVDSAGILAPQYFPFGGPRVRGQEFLIETRTGAGRGAGVASDLARAEVYTATPDYFAAVRIPLLRGRLFDRTDTASAEPVALISDVVASRAFRPGADPVGQRVRFDWRDPSSPWVTIVGVVGDVRNPVGADVQPTAYRLWTQNPSAGGIFFVRVRGETGQSLSPHIDAIRKVLREADPVAPEFGIVPLTDPVSSYILPQRFSARLLAGFAVFGLLLAGAGVYSVMRYWVQARVAEIGIRRALGAQAGSVVRLVLRRSAVASGLGGLAGLGAAFAFRKVLESQLYGVSSTDPFVFVAVTCVMAFTALAAAFVPARMAAAVDPVVALREE